MLLRKNDIKLDDEFAPILSIYFWFCFSTRCVRRFRQAISFSYTIIVGAIYCAVSWRVKTINTGFLKLPRKNLLAYISFSLPPFLDALYRYSTLSLSFVSNEPCPVPLYSYTMPYVTHVKQLNMFNIKLLWQISINQRSWNCHFSVSARINCSSRLEKMTLNRRG